MNTLAPVRALCYPTDQLASVTAPPYDDIDVNLFRELTERSEYNVVRVDLPRGSGLGRYEVAAGRLRTWMERGLLRYGERNVVLRYRQSFSLPGSEEKLERGSFIALLKIAPYHQGVLPHEKTLDAPCEDRYRVFMATRANLSPIFFLYHDPSFVVDEAFDVPTHPVSSYTDHAGVAHELSALRDAGAMERVASFVETQQLIIADGHHRYEAARRCSEALVKQGEDAPDAAHRYVIGMFVNEHDPGLRIRATHRVVRKKFDFDLVRDKLAPWIEFVQTDEDPRDAWRAIASRGDFAVMVSTLGVFRLRLTCSADGCTPLQAVSKSIRGLPVSVLHTAVFSYGMGIWEKEQAAGEVIKFKRGLENALAKLEKKRTRAVFLLPPVGIADVRRACESGAFMPQKSTAFFPKAPAGLVIHTFEQGRQITPLAPS